MENSVFLRYSPPPPVFQLNHVLVGWRWRPILLLIPGCGGIGCGGGCGAGCGGCWASFAGGNCPGLSPMPEVMVLTSRARLGRSSSSISSRRYIPPSTSAKPSRSAKPLARIVSIRAGYCCQGPVLAPQPGALRVADAEGADDRLGLAAALHLADCGCALAFALDPLANIFAKSRSAHEAHGAVAP